MIVVNHSPTPREMEHSAHESGIPVRRLDTSESGPSELFVRRDHAVQTARTILLARGTVAGIYRDIPVRSPSEGAAPSPDKLPLDDLMGYAAQRYDVLILQGGTGMQEALREHVVRPLSEAFEMDAASIPDHEDALLRLAATWHERSGCRCGGDRLTVRDQRVVNNQALVGRLLMDVAQLPSVDRSRIAERYRALGRSECLAEARVLMAHAAADRLPASVMRTTETAASSAVRTIFQRALRPRAETENLAAAVRDAALGLLMHEIAHSSFARAMHEALEPVLPLNEILVTSVSL